MGILLSMRCALLGSDQPSRPISVITTVGLTEFTRIWWGEGGREGGREGGGGREGEGEGTGEEDGRGGRGKKALEKWLSSYKSKITFKESWSWPDK